MKVLALLVVLSIFAQQSEHHSCANAPSGIAPHPQRKEDPLFRAIYDGNIAQAEKLIAGGADLNAHNSFDSTPLLACLEYLTKLRPAGVVSAQQRDLAEKKEELTHESIALAILKHKIDPDAADPAGQTALIRVAMRRLRFLPAAESDVKLSRLLLAAGAHVNAQDTFGRTALMYAAWREKRELVKYLLSAGASNDLVDCDGNTALKGKAQKL